MGLGLGLGLGLTVTGTGLNARNAGRGNPSRRSRRGRGRSRSSTSSGIRAGSSSSLRRGARNGGGPSRFNQVLLRSVVWFGGTTERHYHNKGNGARRSPAETGGPLFRNETLAAFGLLLRRSVLRCAALRCVALRCVALPSEYSPITQRGRAPPAGPREERTGRAETDQTKATARRGKVRQGRAARLKIRPGIAVVTVLSLSQSPAPTPSSRDLSASATGGDLYGSCVRLRYVSVR